MSGLRRRSAAPVTSIDGITEGHLPTHAWFGVPGHFPVVCRLGGGQFGDAYLCKDAVRDDALVAIKRLRLLGQRNASPQRNRTPRRGSPLRSNERDAARTLDLGQQLRSVVTEANHHAQLLHPNVVGLHTVWVEPDGHTCLAMEACEGGTLAELHQARYPLAEGQVLHYLQQILRGLSSMHDRRLLHRDLKLDNLFLNRNKHVVKIGDFGLSSQLSTNGYADSLAGTPMYCSPEMARGDPYSAPSDVWSFGVVAYTLLCDAPLFPDATTSDAFLHGLMHDPIPEVRAVAPEGISDTTCDLVQCALSRNARSRPSCHALLEHPAFSEYQEEGSVGRPRNLPVRTLEVLHHVRRGATINVRNSPSLEADKLPVPPLKLGTMVRVVARPASADGTQWLEIVHPVSGYCVVSWQGHEIFVTADVMHGLGGKMLPPIQRPDQKPQRASSPLRAMAPPTHAQRLPVDPSTRKRTPSPLPVGNRGHALSASARPVRQLSQSPIRHLRSGN